MATQAEQISDILVIVNEIKTQLGVFGTVQGRHEEQITANTRTLRGVNGTPGLVADVDNVKSALKWIQGVGGALIIAVIIDIVMRIVSHVY